MEEVDIGSGEKVSDKKIIRWFRLLWKSAEREPFTMKDLLFFVIIGLLIVNIVVSIL